MSKKTLCALTSLACVGLVSLSADQYSSNNKSSDDKNNMNHTGPHGYVITPSAQPGGDFQVTADFIWWRPNLEGSTAAYPGYAYTPGVNAEKGKIHNNFNFKPGFKIGVGTTFDHDRWDLYLDYTWFRAHGHKHNVTADGDETIWTDLFLADAPVGVPGSFSPDFWSVQGAQSNLKFHFNVLDLELGRNFWISKYLTLRPHFGLKGAWIKEKQNIGYSGVSVNSILTSTRTVDVNLKQRFWGIGIRGGLDTAWHFTKNFSLYGDVALAGLYAQYKDSRTDEFTLLAVTQTTFNGKAKLNTVEPVLELGLGLEYQLPFHNDDYQFMFAVGWEEQVWFNHNQNLNIGAHRNGNLTLQGLTVEVGFTF